MKDIRIFFMCGALLFLVACEPGGESEKSGLSEAVSLKSKKERVAVSLVNQFDLLNVQVDKDLGTVKTNLELDQYIYNRESESEGYGLSGSDGADFDILCLRSFYECQYEAAFKEQLEGYLSGCDALTIETLTALRNGEEPENPALNEVGVFELCYEAPEKSMSLTGKLFQDAYAGKQPYKAVDYLTTKVSTPNRSGGDVPGQGQVEQDWGFAESYVKSLDIQTKLDKMKGEVEGILQGKGKKRVESATEVYQKTLGDNKVASYLSSIESVSGLSPKQAGEIYEKVYNVVNRDLLYLIQELSSKITKLQKSSPRQKRVTSLEKLKTEINELHSSYVTGYRAKLEADFAPMKPRKISSKTLEGTDLDLDAEMTGKYQSLRESTERALENAQVRPRNDSGLEQGGRLISEDRLARYLNRRQPRPPSTPPPRKG